MGIGAELLVRLASEHHEFVLRDALILNRIFKQRPKPPPSRGPIDTAQVTLVLAASRFWRVATKSSAPPKQAA
jgi:hypothetical protein